MNYEQWVNTTQHLIPVIRRKIERNEPPEVLNRWSSPCGTYGCVAGDCVISMGYEGYNVNNPWEPDLKNASTLLYISFSKVFGFFAKESGVDVFGQHDAGTLQQRLDYVLAELHDAGHTEAKFNGKSSINVREIVEHAMSVELETVEG